MSKSTISTFELFRMFPDQESARVYFEARRWPDGATCPALRLGKPVWAVLKFLPVVFVPISLADYQ